MLTPETVLQNRYILQQKLNDNPARQTWIAKDSLSQEQVVVKLLALGGAVQWDDLKLFEREAQILKQLNHPRIPKCRDYFSLDDRTLWFGLVQEYIPGASLKQKLNEGTTFTQEQIEQIAEDILKILLFLHQLNPPVLHRDIKPSNLILGEDMEVYLIDFGAVQARPNAAGRTFTVVGTYGYTPMEQFGGQAVPASDLYALGATLIHLLTGMAPSDLPQHDLRIQFRDRLSFSVDHKLINWLEKLTEPSLKKRFSNAQEALEALKGNDFPIHLPSDNSFSSSYVRLEKSSEKLSIFIPSRFEIEFVRPFLNWGKRIILGLKQKIIRQVERFKSLDKQKQRQLMIGGGCWLTGFLLLDIFTSVSITGFIFGIVRFLLSIPFSLLPLALPAWLIIWVMLYNQKVDYLEKIKIEFDTNNFEIIRESSGSEKRETGDILEIKDVYLTAFQDMSGKIHQSIVINTNAKGEKFFLGSKEQQYIFGHQLSKAELRWLIQEIQDWIDNNVEC
ncbi:MAG: serine/threonine protein kinase [Moorea sp. SIO2B7]|nr:serine/threonine protein kinase [Moorena sp. SIO2B7]